MGIALLLLFTSRRVAIIVFNFQLAGINFTTELLFLDRADCNKCTLRNMSYYSVLFWAQLQFSLTLTGAIKILHW
jgi:hypothetical protein